MSPSAKRRKQEETCSDMHGPTTHINLPSEGAKESPVAQVNLRKRNKFVVPERSPAKAPGSLLIYQQLRLRNLWIK